MKRLTIALLISILAVFILVFTSCQQKKDYSQLINDAEYIYSYVDDEFTNGNEMSSYKKDKLYEFKKTYINNYDDYKDEKELLSYMEQLVFGYEFYYIAMGQGDEVVMDKKKKDIEEALEDLDEYFNE